MAEIAFSEVIVKLATGRNHVLALDEHGRVYAWGKNEYG